MRVFINPGHAPNGNPDPGAVNANTGLRECDVALVVGTKVAAYLETAGCETKVLQSDSLDEICEAANSWPADTFVSIHCNSAVSEEANGFEVWTSPGQTAGDDLATCIYQQIMDQFPDRLGRSDYSDDDADKEARFYVLVHTDAPACLVEMAFISNDEEARLLAEPTWQDTYARAIACGVTDYFSEKEG